MRRFAFVAPLCALSLSLCSPVVLAAPKTVQSAPTADAPMSRAQFERHVLNRLAFGARPGEAAELRRVGFEAWLNRQLSPQTLDLSEVDAKVARLETLSLPRETLMLAYAGETAGFVRRLVNAKPTVRADGRERKPATPREELKPRQQELLDRYRAANLSPGVSLRALGELATEKLVRAVESPAQLNEVMVDFWSNHFNIDARKGLCRTLKIADEREVVRPQVWGKFRALLGASAKSPAMLVYLDNARSTREVALSRRGKTRGGINENYARELMELHTLGVEGGYSQKDVSEVARCFTGWSFSPITGEFTFRPLAHDNGEKLVLGHKIPADGGGIRDGERVLDILASHPSTARHIARKLCQRLVSDAPSEALIARTAQVFTRTQGDLRAVVKSIALSREFRSQTSYRAKIKSPWEFAVSSVRALDGRVLVAEPQKALTKLRFASVGRASLGRSGRGKRENSLLLTQIATMGQPVFGCQAPTGYSEVGTAWVSSGALVGRLNFALALSNGQLADAQLPPRETTSVDELAQRVLDGDVRPETRSAIEREAESGADAAKLTALMLGSPEFQRR